MTTHGTVHLVDDDRQVRELLRALVRSVSLDAKTYASAEEFLQRYSDPPDSPSCLVLDAFMPGMSGLDLQKKLADEGVIIPIIMISAYGDVPMAVEAMGTGAVDFIEKPFNRQVLLKRIQEAIDSSARQLSEKAQRSDVAARLSRLSPREREVMDLLVAGMHTKQIANELGICGQTVARHRLRVLGKLGVESVAELVNVVLSFTLTRRRSTSRTESDVSGP